MASSTIHCADKTMVEADVVKVLCVNVAGGTRGREVINRSDVARETVKVTDSVMLKGDLIKVGGV